MVWDLGRFRFTRQSLRIVLILAFTFSFACAGCDNCGETPALDAGSAPGPDMRNKGEPDVDNRAIAAELAEEGAEQSALRIADSARLITGAIEASASKAPKPKRPRIKGEPETGKLAKAKLNKVFNIHADAMKSCYERSLKKSPGLVGKVRLELLIRASGEVRSANARGISLRDSAVQNCMERQAKTMKFPKPDGGALRVNKSYTFVPDY